MDAAASVTDDNRSQLISIQLCLRCRLSRRSKSITSGVRLSWPGCLWITRLWKDRWCNLIVTSSGLFAIFPDQPLQPDTKRNHCPHSLIGELIRIHCLPERMVRCFTRPVLLTLEAKKLFVEISTDTSNLQYHAERSERNTIKRSTHQLAWLASLCANNLLFVTV